MCYTILTIVGILYALAFLFVLALCQAAWRADDWMEEMHRNMKEEEEQNAAYEKWNRRGFRERPHRN